MFLWFCVLHLRVPQTLRRWPLSGPTFIYYLKHDIPIAISVFYIAIYQSFSTSESFHLHRRSEPFGDSEIQRLQADHVSTAGVGWPCRSIADGGTDIDFIKCWVYFRYHYLAFWKSISAEFLFRQCWRRKRSVFVGLECPRRLPTARSIRLWILFWNFVIRSVQNKPKNSEGAHLFKCSA